MYSRKKVVVYKQFWSSETTNKNPNCLFIYGDNDKHYGKGGQAIIRDEPNSAGIPTKKTPLSSADSFYTDREYTDNIKKIDAALNYIISIFTTGNYNYLVLPSDGFGTGLSQLPSKAPATYYYLQTKIENLKGLFGVEEYKLG